MQHMVRMVGWCTCLFLITCLSGADLYGQSKSMIDSTNLLTQLLPELPLTKVKSRGVSSARSQYVLSIDFETELITVEDQRILSRNGEKNPNDGYIISLPLADLHRDGILLIKEEAKGTISLSILATNNRKAFTVTPLLTKGGQLSFPQDRLLLGPWSITSNPSIESQLERIRGLMSWIAKKEGTKRKKYTPSFERDSKQVFTSKAVNAAPLPAGSKSSPKTAIAIEEMDEPPLFQSTQQLQDLAPAIESYIHKQLKAKDIQLKYAVQGKFIVNESGQVSFVKIDFALDKGAKQLIERILKEMPAWNVGTHEGKTRSALIPFAIKAKQ